MVLVDGGTDFEEERFFDEAYSLKFSIHLTGDKMYHDLKLMFWWSGMNTDIVKHVSHYLTCQRLKVRTNDQVVCFNLWRFRRGSGIIYQ